MIIMARGRSSERQPGSLPRSSSPSSSSSSRSFPPSSRRRRHPSHRHRSSHHRSSHHDVSGSHQSHEQRRNCSHPPLLDRSNPPPPSQKLSHRHSISKPETHQSHKHQSRSESPKERSRRWSESRRVDQYRDRSSEKNTHYREESSQNSHQGPGASREVEEFTEDMGRSDDFYRPPMSNGYAPGNNPRSRGVQESDRYRPKPSEYEEAHSRTSRAYVAGDNPSSRGVQESDNYRPAPVEHKEKPVRSRYSAAQDAMLVHPKQLNAFESWRPHQRPSNDVPSFAAGTTLFSFNDDVNMDDSPGHITMKNSLTTRKFGNCIFHDEDMHDGPACPPQSSNLGPHSGTGPLLLNNSKVLPQCSEHRTRQFVQVGNDGKPARMEDPAASRRLFGGIIKSRRSSEAAFTLPSPSPSRSDHSSRTILPLRILSSPSPTLASQYGVPRGFELVRGGAQPRSKSNNSSIPITALTPISTNTHSEIRASSPFSCETRGTPTSETAWQRMVRESNERWKNSSE